MKLLSGQKQASKMRPSIVVMLIILSIGCGGSSGHNSDYVKPTPNQTSLNFEIWYYGKLPEPIADHLEAHWLDVQSCVGVAAPITPYKVSVRYLQADNMPKPIGAMDTNTHTIYIDVDYMYEVIVLRHEMIHHLLDLIGVTLESQEKHEPEWVFNECVYIDWQKF